MRERQYNFSLLKNEYWRGKEWITLVYKNHFLCVLVGGKKVESRENTAFFRVLNESESSSVDWEGKILTIKKIKTDEKGNWVNLQKNALFI